jgi:hypothetical protein
LVHRIAAFRVDAVLLPRRRHVFEWSDRCVGCCASIRMHWTRPQTILARYYSNLAFRINAKSCAPLQIGFPLVLTIREGEAPAEPNCCLAVGSLGSAAASPLREGEAPAEPNCCLAAESHGSAGASPSHVEPTSTSSVPPFQDNTHWLPPTARPRNATTIGALRGRNAPSHRALHFTLSGFFSLAFHCRHPQRNDRCRTGHQRISAVET